MVRPCTGVVRRWHRGPAVLLGDAAHPVMPHLGLGGSQTLEDVPLLLELILRALRTGPDVLADFRKARASRVRYVQRVSYVWAAMSAAPRPFGILRNYRMTHMDPKAMLSFIATLAASSVPSWNLRRRVWLP